MQYRVLCILCIGLVLVPCQVYAQNSQTGFSVEWTSFPPSVQAGQSTTGWFEFFNIEKLAFQWIVYGEWEDITVQPIDVNGDPLRFQVWIEPADQSLKLGVRVKTSIGTMPGVYAYDVYLFSVAKIYEVNASFTVTVLPAPFTPDPVLSLYLGVVAVIFCLVVVGGFIAARMSKPTKSKKKIRKKRRRR